MRLKKYQRIDDTKARPLIAIREFILARKSLGGLQTAQHIQNIYKKGEIMKKTGAWLTAYALEQVGVRFTFGIPGVHVTELYDELNKSKQIDPILVTHEAGAAFMADAVSRTTDSIGTLAIVPAAGVTHAMSGIGEAYLDGIPMLIISGGVRQDSGHKFQLHQMDLHKLLEGIVKKNFLVDKHKNLVSTLFEAYDTAISNEPGPVFLEIPVEIQMFQGELSELPQYTADENRGLRLESELQPAIVEAANLLMNSQSPGIFVGWGARNSTEELQEIADLLNAPVATTLQGLSVFPYDHPLHTGMGFGNYSVPAAANAFANCDTLLAVATRFAEIPTGSFSLQVPNNLIHIDINPAVFNANYPAKQTIQGDAKQVLNLLARELRKRKALTENTDNTTQKRIQQDKQNYLEEWLQSSRDGIINPAAFFQKLSQQLSPNDYVVLDDGNHTYLAAELFPVYRSGHFISPTDFNSMGYGVPAAIGTHLGHRDQRTVAIVGDGAFLMTGLELLTATTNNLGVVIFVFHDGELSQISQGQEIPYNRKTCTVLGEVKLEGIAQATGSRYFYLAHNNSIESTIQDAFAAADQGQPVIIDVKIDYSKRTRFTKGVVKANLQRFALGEKFRFIGRAFKRKVTG